MVESLTTQPPKHLPVNGTQYAPQKYFLQCYSRSREMKFALCKGVIVRQDGDEAIVYDPNENKLFLLNETAWASVRAILNCPQSVKQVAAQIEAEYEVLPATSEEDLEALFDELAKLALIYQLRE
jgi:hypothetical protein